MLKVFLVVITIHSSSSPPQERVYPMQDMSACLEAVKSAKTVVANNGDSEGGFAVFCTNERNIADRWGK